MVEINKKTMKLKRVQLLFVQILISIAVFGQNNKTIDFDVDSFRYKDSIGCNLTFEQTAQRIEHFCTTDTQKLCLVAGWIFNNIEFDLNKFYRGGNVPDYNVVFASKKGTCGDYSSIFSAFCDRLNIKNEIIEGYVPEYKKDNNRYYETNHAWNIVKVGADWYHCDLLGFSGYLQRDSANGYQFIKRVNAKSFLTHEIAFLAKHIPADPIWQLSDYPIPLDTLLKFGVNAKTDSTQRPVNYKEEIDIFIKLSDQKKSLLFADNAFNYNKNNHNAIVINYYNAAVDLIRNWNNDKSKLIQAKEYLTKANAHVHLAKNGPEILEDDIIKALDIIHKYVP